MSTEHDTADDFRTALELLRGVRERQSAVEAELRARLVEVEAERDKAEADNDLWEDAARLVGEGHAEKVAALEARVQELEARLQDATYQMRHGRWPEALSALTTGKPYAGRTTP